MVLACYLGKITSAVNAADFAEQGRRIVQMAALRSAIHHTQQDDAGV